MRDVGQATCYVYLASRNPITERMYYSGTLKSELL